MIVFYAHQKLEEAVRLLTTGHGELRSRLEQAFLALATLQEEDLPEPLRDDFRWIRARSTKLEPGDEDEILRETPEQMEARATERIAERIVELQRRLSSHLDEYDL
jgi:hypothetical protein